MRENPTEKKIKKEQIWIYPHEAKDFILKSFGYLACGNVDTILSEAVKSGAVRVKGTLYEPYLTQVSLPIRPVKLDDCVITTSGDIWYLKNGKLAFLNIRINNDDLKKYTKDLTRDTETLIEKRGRGKGSGSFKSDAPLLQKMKELIKNKEANSVRAAADKVAPEAKGQSAESTITRLSRKFKKEFQEEYSSLGLI